MSEKLLPCPFCGSTKIDAEGWSSLPEYKGKPEYRSGPACDDCGASAGSVAEWNTRSDHAPKTRNPINAVRIDGDDIQHLKIIRGHLEIVREILSKATIDATFGEEAIASSIGWLNAYLGELTTDEWDENYNAMVEAVNEGRP